MKFYDENMDLYQLIEKANLGDVGTMIKCIGYNNIFLSKMIQQLQKKSKGHK